MGKLWEKDVPLDPLIERFTVGDDYLLDRSLVNADCLASMAHAAMLEKIGILSPPERKALHRELAEIIRLSDQGRFRIEAADEDCHTAIENRLVSRLGEAGKKIHTGRSRNDQVLAALRLYGRAFLLEFLEACLDLADSLLEFARRHAGLPMPGRTHLQLAMPSSVGLWAGAYAEELLDDLRLAEAAYELNDACPLGSAAGYGAPLPLDRELTAGLLGFGRVQNNVLYAGNSRGKTEAVILEAVEQVMLTLSRLAQDLILFSLPEFGYFSLPEELCAGSSIMPQKRNPDLLELVRAKAAGVSARVSQVKAVLRGLPSGYNRDLQESKAAFMEGLATGLASVRVMERLMRRLGVHEERLSAGFRPEIYATHRALELAAGGTPFREAYRQVARNLEALEGRDPREAIQRMKHTGAPGNLRLEVPEAQARDLRERTAARKRFIQERLTALAGFEVALYHPPAA
jgi:argininosuccinate lyase